MVHRYRPAIALDVLDTLFVYFTKNTKTSVVSIALQDYSIGKQIAWHLLEADLSLTNNDTAPVDTVWQLALAVDDILRADTIGTCDAFRKLCTELPHGNAIPTLLDTYWAQGHHYISFTILVTILERTLYNTYARLNQSQKPNMILRDLLKTSELIQTLPPGLLLLLHILFFPSGLNLRNLVWHGFVAPVDMPSCFTSLLLVILSDCVFRQPLNKQPLYASLPPFHTSTHNIFMETKEFLAKSNVSALFQSQSARTRSRLGLTQQAVKAFMDGKDVLSLFLAIPVLEYLIRCEFVNVNPSVPRGMAEAQLSEYYSTLDGFGQRNQHQVLLARELFDSNVKNQLYDTIQLGALNACIDLFMCAAGPNIRAKLCHGELDLDSLWSSEVSTIPHKICASLVLLLILQLLQKDESIGLLTSYSSQFHPYAMIQMQLSTCSSEMQRFRELVKESFKCTIEDAGQQMHRMVFIPATSPKPLVIIESSSRMVPKPGTKSVPSGIEYLSFLLNEYVEWFANESTTLHSWLTGKDYESVLIPLNLRTFGDNISSAVCMQAILQAAQRHLQNYRQRLVDLKTLLEQGSARTSHRRTLLTMILFQTCFSQMIALVIAMVELNVHQCINNCSTKATEEVPTKLLQFIVAFEDDKKSIDKLLQMATQFWQSKAIRKGFFNM